MITVSVKIEPKKGVFKETLWGICQDSPVPYCSNGLYNWEGIPPSTHDGLPEIYRFALLREGWTPETAEYNRRDYAGFNGNGGGIIFRGRDLGEITGTIDNSGVCYFFGGLTEGAFDFLCAQVAPSLIKAASDNKTVLQAEAIERLRREFDDALFSMRENLRRLADEANNVMSSLQGGKEK